MKETPTIIKSLVTFVLISAVVILIALNWIQSKEDKRLYNDTSSEYVLQLDTLQSELEASRKQRDSFVLLVDSIDSVNTNYLSRLAQKDFEIAKIKGRYNKVSQDSLAVLMNARAGKNSR